MKKILILILLLAFLKEASFADNASKESLNDWLVITKSTLHSGDKIEIRVVAAKQLLLSSEAEARKIITETITNKEETEAKKAIFLALIESDKWSQKLPNTDQLAKSVCEALKVCNENIAELCCKAMTVFEFELIEEKINDMLLDDQTSTETRLMIICALKERLPERKAIKTLFNLLDNENEQISKAAGEALQEWVPLGKDKKSWGEIIDELNQKSPSAIIKERLIGQESKVRQLEAEVATLKTKNVETQEELYNFKTTNDGKKDFLLKYLKDSEAQVRVWAIDKISQWRSSTQLPGDFSSLLIDLISDPSEKVRLKIAQLLIFMGDIDPDEELLDQLKKENNEEIAIAQLHALSEACYYAYIAVNKIQIAPQVRSETLSIINSFLKSESPSKITEAGDSLARILEKNGLDEEIVKQNLDALLDVYTKKLNDNPEAAMSLLGAMTRLCHSSSFYRSLSGTIFKQSFLTALDSNNDNVRELAIEGLINIDPAAALKDFKSRELYNDSNKNIVSKMIELTSEVGQAEDIQWILAKCQSKELPCWKSILRILQRCEPKTAWDWVVQFEKIHIGDDELIKVLELVEKKSGLAAKARVKLAQIYQSQSNVDNAEKYYNLALSARISNTEKEQIEVELFKIYLTKNQYKDITSMIRAELSAMDIDINNKFAALLDGHFKDMNINISDKKMLLSALSAVAVKEEHPFWNSLLKSWQNLLEPPVQNNPQ